MPINSSEKNYILEQRLAAQFLAYKVLLTSRGSTALYLALKAINKEGKPGEVILPATVCPSVPFVVMLAGLKPRFCDVELDTFCMSPRTILPCLSEQTKAIIAVYLFGKSLDIEGILKIASPNQIPVIEDIAQAIGGEHQGRLLGSFAEFTILSFDSTKIIPGTGGALLCRNQNIFDDIVHTMNKLPLLPFAGTFHELSRGFRDITMGIYDLMRSENIQTPISFPLSIIEKFRTFFVHRRVASNLEMKSTIEQIDSLPQERERRFRNYQTYIKQLGAGMKPVLFSSAEMCWRLPILVKDHHQQLAVLDEIRANGDLVSNHYFPVSFLFGDTNCECAREIGMRALNFWVDQKVTDEDITRLCTMVKKHTLN